MRVVWIMAYSGEMNMEDLVAQLAARYGAASHLVRKLAEGENHIYEFSRDGVPHILRMTEGRRRQREDLLAETEFVAYLNARKGPAVTLVYAEDGSRVVSCGAGESVLHAYCYIKAEGEFASDAAWGPEIFRLWGRTAGELHHLARDFHPTERPRYQWFDDPDILRLEESSGDDAAIGQRCRALVARLREYPATAANYGLIHADLHPWNMSYHQGRIQVFDFDDCQYDFFLKEAAAALFSSNWHPDGTLAALRQRPDETAHAKSFLESFFAGYCEVEAIDAAGLPLLQDMLKLQRCILWGCLREDGDELGDWAPVYDKWRREIIDDVPFVDLDFSQFA